MDGSPYYFNMKTEEVSWNTPESLKDTDTSEYEGGEWVWCADPEEAWVPGRSVGDNTYLTNNGNRFVGAFFFFFFFFF